jgi:hypothetical protein
MAALIPLPSTMMSGTTFHSSYAQRRPVRPRPAWTSSRIITMPRSSHSLRIRGYQSSGGTLNPAVAGIVSMITAAVSSSTEAASASKSPCGTVRKPGVSGP